MLCKRIPPSAPRTRRLQMRIAAKTVAYLMEEPTHTAIPHSPIAINAAATTLRRARWGCRGWPGARVSPDTSFRNINAGLTSAMPRALVAQTEIPWQGLQLQL